MADNDNSDEFEDKDNGDYDPSTYNSANLHFTPKFESSGNPQKNKYLELVTDYSLYKYLDGKARFSILLENVSKMDPESKEHATIIKRAFGLLARINEYSENLFSLTPTIMGRDYRAEKRVLKNLGAILYAAAEFPEYYPILRDLHIQMQDSVDKEDYERAAILRENIAGIMNKDVRNN